MALIEIVLYVTLSLIVYTANREVARFSKDYLPSSRIVRPCCFVDRCQCFGGTSCLHFQNRRVIVTSRSLVHTDILEESSVFSLRCRRVGRLTGIRKCIGASFFRAEHGMLAM
jgi:hypothetical protein